MTLIGTLQPNGTVVVEATECLIDGVPGWVTAFALPASLYPNFGPGDTFDPDHVLAVVWGAPADASGYVTGTLSGPNGNPFVTAGDIVLVGACTDAPPDGGDITQLLWYQPVLVEGAPIPDPSLTATVSGSGVVIDVAGCVIGGIPGYVTVIAVPASALPDWTTEDVVGLVYMEAADGVGSLTAYISLVDVPEGTQLALIGICSGEDTQGNYFEYPTVFITTPGLAPIPSSIAPPECGDLFMTSYAAGLTSSSTIREIDPGSGAIVGQAGPYPAVFNGIAATPGRLIAVLPGSTWWDVDLGGTVLGGALSTNAAQVYDSGVIQTPDHLIASDSNQVVDVDLTTGDTSIVATSPLDRQILDTAYLDDTLYAVQYAPEGGGVGETQLLRVDGSTVTVVGPSPAGTRFTGLAQVGSDLWAVDHHSGDLFRVDVSSGDAAVVVSLAESGIAFDLASVPCSAPSKAECTATWTIQGQLKITWTGFLSNGAVFAEAHYLSAPSIQLPPGTNGTVPIGTGSSGSYLWSNPPPNTGWLSLTSGTEGIRCEIPKRPLGPPTTITVPPLDK